MHVVGLFVIISFQGKVKFVVTQVIGLFPVLQPGKLQLVGSLLISQENDDKFAVIGSNSSCFNKPQILLIKLNAFFQVTYVKIVMAECKTHTKSSLSLTAVI